MDDMDHDGELMVSWKNDMVCRQHGEWMTWWLADMGNGCSGEWMLCCMHRWHGVWMLWCIDDMVEYIGVYYHDNQFTVISYGNKASKGSVIKTNNTVTCHGSWMTVILVYTAAICPFSSAGAELKSQVKYGIGELKWVAVLDKGSL